MIKFKEIKATHTLLWCSKSCYLDLWIYFITEIPGSQPAGEMWDLDLLFLTSVRDDFLPRPAQQVTAGPWMSSSWGWVSVAWMWLCCPPQGTWLAEAQGVPMPGAGAAGIFHPWSGHHSLCFTFPVSGLGNTDSRNCLSLILLQTQWLFWASRNACPRGWVSGLNGLMQVKEPSHDAM